MTLVGCAALRPFALTIRPEPHPAFSSPDGAASGDGAVLPVTYEANFKRRGLHSGNKRSGSAQSTPRSARSLPPAATS